MMTAAWMVVMSALAAQPSSASFEREGVRIEVTVASHIYRWKVTNLSARPINSFEVGQYHMYNHTVPEGWVMENERELFRARVQDALNAIVPGQSVTFLARVSSAGAVLGRVTAEVGFEGAASPLVMQDVWGAVHEPMGKILAIPLTLSALALLHTWLMTRRKTRTAHDAVSGA